MADELTSVDFQQGIDSVSGDVSDLSQKLDTLSTDLSQKLDALSTDLSQKSDTLSSDVSQKLDGVTNGLDVANGDKGDAKRYDAEYRDNQKEDCEQDFHYAASIWQSTTRTRSTM